MAYKHSYGATVKNNKTENSAVDFVLTTNSHFRQPTKEERKALLVRFGLPSTFARAFDLVLLPSAEETDALKVPIEKIILIELKTTQKKLPENPKGFFFGATENEFKLADKLGEQYKFCFVSLHPESKNFVLLTLDELAKRIKTKRLQYQINL